MTTYRFALAGAIVSSFLLIWLSLGVGIIGADGDPSNRLYFGVIAVGIAGALLVRGRPRGMAHTMVAMAVATAGIGVFAIATGLGMPYSGPLELMGLNGFFVALFVGAAWLFRRAAV